MNKRQLTVVLRWTLLVSTVFCSLSIDWVFVWALILMWHIQHCCSNWAWLRIFVAGESSRTPERGDAIFLLTLPQCVEDLHGLHVHAKVDSGLFKAFVAELSGFLFPVVLEMVDISVGLTLFLDNLSSPVFLELFSGLLGLSCPCPLALFCLLGDSLGAFPSKSFVLLSVALSLGPAPLSAPCYHQVLAWNFGLKSSIN